jgi:leucyl/phenylalanyl-tRNA--protein transferase
MIDAYLRLHHAGHAHSLEVWLDQALVGGIYGIAIGRAFFGESMFHLASDASKVALVSLCQFLELHRFGLLDCQLESPHLIRMGAINIPRTQFRQRIDSLCEQPGPNSDWNSVARPVQLAPDFQALDLTHGES